MFAQYVPADSLLQLAEISIKAKKDKIVATQKLKNQSNSNTSVQVEQLSPVYLNRQSSNGLATISIRGAAATNVPVLWENWIINSSMNSLFDVNLINPYLFDQLQINYGAQKTNAGWGGAGGSLQFSNNIKNNEILKAHQFGLHTQIGSFGHKEIGLNYTFIKPTYNNLFKVVWNTSENDFPILKEDSPNEERTNNLNAELINKAFINKGLIKIDDENSLNYSAWWHYTTREIPPTLTATNTNALQTDSAGRFSLNWENTNQWKFGFAYFDELNLYEAQSVNIYGRHRVKSWLSQFNHQFDFAKRMNVSYSLNYESFLAKSTNLTDDGVRRNRLLIFPKFQYHFAALPVHAILGVSAEYTDKKWAPILPNVIFKTTINQIHQVNIVMARHYRLPSFNDLYWQPGGNINLVAESGWNQEINWTTKIKQFSFQLNLFNHNNSNKIIWLPEQGIWRPNNIAKVNSQGLETNFSTHFNFNKHQFKAEGFYAFTKAINREAANNNAIIGKQLIYTPKHKTGISLNYQIQQFAIEWSQALTGKRFTNSDNSQSINAYHFANMNFNYQFQIKHMDIELGLYAENLFNKYYEVVLNRPMPGRNFLINLNFNI